MATIPGLSANSLNSYSQSVQPSDANAAAAAQQKQNPQEQAANAQSSVIATLTSNDRNAASSALTYNASGLLTQFQQAVPQAGSSDTEQAARDAVRNAQDAITQEQGTLNTDAAQNGSSPADTLTQFGQTPQASASSQSAQAALMQAQYQKNQELNSSNDSNQSAAIAVA